MAKTIEAAHCPKCGKEMLRGRTPIGYNHHLFWFPEDKASSLSRGVRLNASIFRCKRHPSWYCPDCEFLTIDTKHYYD